MVTGCPPSQRIKNDLKNLKDVLSSLTDLTLEIHECATLGNSLLWRKCKITFIKIVDCIFLVLY
jgi:hypothetical protein